jgi:transposase-like protein
MTQSSGSGQREVVKELEENFNSPLDDVLREGARQMLLSAVEAEVHEYVARHAACVDELGRRLVVRNGRARKRTVLTGLGVLRVRAPRVDDRRRDEQGRRHRFTSAILPPYLRKTRSVEELIPWLYLKGISTGDFSEALKALVGPDAPGLSASTVVRLKERWSDEYDAWRRSDLDERRYVYIWADGIYCNVRLDDERQCLLVVIGATADGRKQLLAVHDGFRESELSWTEVLVNLKERGLQVAPNLAVGDGALGFWAALRKVFPQTLEQRCWVHKTANVLNKLPKSMQGKAKAMLHDIYLAETREAAEKAFDRFVNLYKSKYPKAVDCLVKDREALLAFYDFPAEHWPHLRTTNPVESTFATVRLRHRRTKGCGSRQATLTMVFMLARQAERRWRRLNGSKLIVHVLEGKTFKDGTLVENEKSTQEGAA